MVEGVIDRARWRTTLVYRVHPRFQAGLEYNPLDDDLGVIANLRVVTETRDVPAVIVGTSSDRIGTPDGRAYYGTVSKDLEHWTGLPFAPYAGASYGEFDDEWVFIGGLNVRWGDGVRSTHLYDGENVHHIVNRRFGRWSAGLLLVEQDDGRHFGVTASIDF